MATDIQIVINKHYCKQNLIWQNKCFLSSACLYFTMHLNKKLNTISLIH